MAELGAHDLGELERFAGAILASLKPSERRSLLRKMARSLRRSQQQRITAQKNPDGSRFEPRKRPKEPVPGGYAVKFLYPAGGSGAPRLVTMHSWTRQGPLMTGYDVEAGGLRSFEWRKVIRWLPVEPGEQNKGAGQLRRPSVRQRAMFRKIRRSGAMSANATDQEAFVAFAGRVAGRCDCSTIRMISSFSDAGYLIRRLPHPRSCFFSADGSRASGRQRIPSGHGPHGAGPAPRQWSRRGRCHPPAGACRPP